MVIEWILWLIYDSVQLVNITPIIRSMIFMTLVYISIHRQTLSWNLTLTQGRDFSMGIFMVKPARMWGPPVM
jgi:hypothetical protein